MYSLLKQRFNILQVANIHFLVGSAMDVRGYPRSPSFDPLGRSIQSTASAPSLRSRNSVPVSMGRSQEASNGGNVKVVVRVRAFLPREIQKGAGCLVQMDPNTEETKLLAPNSSDVANSKFSSRKTVEDKSFTFDKSFWSHNPADKHYSHQEDVYNSLGEEMLDHNFEGYHTCIFAYGQTGSGKSYTMMGTADQPGLIPRTCEDLFERIESNESSNVTYSVRVSYFEVYNEHVRDLLVPRSEHPYYLKIRESPTDGPYVKDLTDHQVRSYQDIMRLMKLGDLSRTTASTKMNDTSSRSHAVFTITLKQMHADLTTDETTERTARIRLVDLAGSERAKATEATGDRLREGSNINKSLTTLGRVIAALASEANKPSVPRKKPKELVPYRDSILTWLLKDSLGGNSRTAMIACVAPSDYDETLSTLRYADQAKRIRTRAVVNQDSMSSAERDAQVQALQETIRSLQVSVSQQAAARKREDDAQTHQLEEYQKQVEKMQRLMEENKQVTECRIKALTTENEALRLHLKLAVESLRNPVIVPAPTNKVEALPVDDLEDAASEGGQVQSASVEKEVEWDDGSDTDVENAELEAVEVHHEMEELLKDLGLFKKKLGDDHSRFFRPRLNAVDVS